MSFFIALNALFVLACGGNKKHQYEFYSFIVKMDNNWENSPIILPGNKDENDANVNTGVNTSSDSSPMTLTFNNLQVFIENRKILDNVSGCVKPGEVLAVMGPSGKARTFLYALSLSLTFSVRLGESYVFFYLLFSFWNCYHRNR